MPNKGSINNFIGRGWSFPPTFEASVGTVIMVQDDVDIQQSLVILFSTMVTERVMLPMYGSSLHQLVFKSIDSSLLAKIKSILTNAILYFESRINLLDIEIIQSDTDESVLQISLTYNIRQTNTRSNMVYPFYLQGEGTNVQIIS